MCSLFSGCSVILSLFVFFLEFDPSWSSRILAVFPIPFHEQQLVFRPIIDKLVERGHHLTVLTTDPIIYNDCDNVEAIDLSFAHRLKVLNAFNDNALSGYEMLQTVYYVMRTIVESELKSIEIQHLLGNDTESFDAVIVDWSGPSLMNGFAYKFNAPLIGITPSGAFMSSHEAMGNPNHPVLYPSILMPFSENLSLLQRIASTIFTLRYRYLYFNEELPLQHEIAKEYFGKDIPNPWEIESKADLLFINNYQSLGYSRPVGPTTIHLGGIHATARKPLPWDLKNFLDESYGTIYLNLPTAVKLAFVNSERLEKLITILERSNFDIVWNLNGFPVAVNTTAKFYQGTHLPQEDILAHKNVKLFITMGGQRDIEDAIHHKVPILGLSFSSNLEHYLMQTLKNDAGISTNLDLESSAMILSKINELNTNIRYKNGIQRLNEIVLDQPMPSVERALWWIEYVIRHGGTKHLNTRIHLAWFEYLLADVFTTLICGAIAMLCVFAIIMVRIKRYSNSLPFEKETRRIKLQKLL